ncbi:c6 finger domain-containing protein [Rutstroemia sp. NJR-2017a WRK4]|nr:c6 finger domain-containing protein [Rutstroemia sp. NJR-2017a WRK4]
METITIPSPSAFLSSPVITPAPKPPPPPKKRKQSTSKASNPSAKKETGITKPKQSKSRNGCITCKAKRLKCDESKPSCQQCYKRSVTCGGYKKDFKWRPFEEATFSNKVAPAPSTKRGREDMQEPQEYSFMLMSPDSIVLDKPPDPALDASPVASEGSTSTPGEDDVHMQESFFNAAVPSPSNFDMSSIPDLQFGNSPLFDMSTPILTQEPRPRIEADSVTSSLSSMFEETGLVTPTTRSTFSGQSPRLIDLLSPGSLLNARQPSLSNPSPTMALTTPVMDHFQFGNDLPLEDDIEEIIRDPPLSDADMWLAQSPFHPQPRSPTASPRIYSPMYRQPDVPAGSPEMLMLRFDKQTCGILSVKDGPTENPWRTLVWPLARDSPALYHAIASMTAFHTSKEKPALRVDGMEHMRRSIRSLATGIEKMRTDTALATTLVLAFSESWDQHISTGIEHLRGAKILVNQALMKHSKRSLVGDDLARLKFLCNTWVYMDVIARLTSIDDDDSTDFEHVLSPLNTSTSFPSASTEIDPLMGSAATLFPLIGRAANLCRKVRKLSSNSIAIISQAMELKQAIEQWSPCTTFSSPEDPTSEIQHALQTAEAYRYATLLHLHQAVPEIPSLTSAQLAKKVLVYLATVPLSSRLVIVQIYPLLAAGCEASEDEDRKWVDERWQSMAQRMWIGNIDRCWEVMQEVWSRRDAVARETEQENLRKAGKRDMGMLYSEGSMRKFEEELANEEINFSDLLNDTGILSRRASPAGQRRSIAAQGGFAEAKRRQEPITEDMDPELTVRGRLHWVGVMKDWEWESTLTPSCLVIHFGNISIAPIVL